MPIRGPVLTIQQSQWTQQTHPPVATCEELSILKCTNKEEAIAYEKCLRSLTERVVHQLQEGLNADPGEPPLVEVMLTLIRDFKTMIAKMYDPVHHANREEVWKSIKDPEGKCLWYPEDDDGNQEAPAEAMVQQEQCAWPEAEEFIQAWDEPLTDKQALLVTDLFRSHTCMLEWQGQVSMLLGKLATSVSPKLFLVILNSTVKLLHQVTPTRSYYEVDPTWEAKMSTHEGMTGSTGIPWSRLHEAVGWWFSDTLPHCNTVLCHQKSSRCTREHETYCHSVQGKANRPLPLHKWPKIQGWIQENNTTLDLHSTPNISPDSPRTGTRFIISTQDLYGTASSFHHSLVSSSRDRQH